MSFFERYAEGCKIVGVMPAGKEAESNLCKAGTISMWKKNGNIPTGELVAKAATWLNISADYLLGLTEDPHPISINKDNTVTAHTIQDNHGIIGHANAPVTIVNGSERTLTEQETALLQIFNEIDVIKQAQLLSFAAELVK